MSAEDEEELSEAETLRLAKEKNVLERSRLIASLERENPTLKVVYPDDIYDFDIWTDDQIVDWFDSGALLRPAPAGIDREGVGGFWPCSICNQTKNRDPAGRELWVGARVEAAAAGGRLFADAIITRIREPQPDAFGEMDPDARTTYDVKFDTGRRENCDRQRVRIAATCKTCGRAKGAVPSWEKGNDLAVAVKRNNLPIVMQLTEAGADLEVRSLSGETPVMLAASAGWNLIVRYLMSQRVDILHQNQEGSTCLALAAAKGHTSSVQAILEENKSLCAIKDGLGRTPLALAAGGGHTDVVRLLCKADRLQVNVTDNQGLSPFFKATSGGHIEAMKTLLDFGATRESLAQSSVRVRDLHAHNGAMRALHETTPEGRDFVFSRALNRRYRMI